MLELFEKYWLEIALSVIWSLLAFFIQPAWITKKLSSKWRNKDWVKVNLECSHMLLSERICNEFIPTLAGLIDESVSNHLKTFKASLFNPIMAQGKRANAEAESAIEAMIPVTAKVQAEAAEKLLKKYPALAFVGPFVEKMGGAQGGALNVPVQLSEGRRGDF